MQTFKAKVGYALLAPILLIISVCFLIPALYGAPRIVLVMMAVTLVPITGFVLYVFFSTVYYIDGPRLIIMNGKLNKWEIDIQTIRSIKKSRLALRSPAPSMDRLHIQYNKYDEILVSPQDKEGFVSALRAINPDIQYG